MTTIPDLPPRYKTLLRYARDQKITRAQAGRGIHWQAPDVRPWLSLERWLRELVAPTGATSVRLYSRIGDRERLLTDFPLGDTANVASTTAANLLDTALLGLEQRINELECRVESLEQDDGDDGDEDDAPGGIPPWAISLAKHVFGGGLGSVAKEPDEELSPQEDVGETEDTEDSPDTRCP